MPKQREQLLVGGVLFLWLGLTIYLAVARGMERPPAAPCPPQRAQPAKPAQQQKPPSRLPPFAKPFEFSVDFYGLTYRGRSDNLIDRHILRFGAYEKDVLFFVRDALRSLAGAEGLFVDVGANTGQHSLFAAKYAARVHAFEPYPPVLAHFRALIALNKLENIVVHPVGLGRKAGEIPFHAPPQRNLGSGSFVTNYQPGNKPVGTLRIVPGDEALKRAGVKRVDVIKIDIEGYEKLALEGLKQTLHSSRPVVVLELTIDPRHAEVFKSAEQLKAAFPKDYRFWRFSMTTARASSGNYQLVPFDLDFTRHGQHMLVVYPQEKEDKLPRHPPTQRP